MTLILLMKLTEVKKAKPQASPADSLQTLGN